MTNSGKMLMNWRAEFPVERVALGLLGRDGFTHTHAAKLLLEHGFLNKAVARCESLGRELTPSAVLSRMRHAHELDNMKLKDPKSYRLGMAMKADLKKYLLERSCIQHVA